MLWKKQSKETRCSTKLILETELFIDRKLILKSKILSEEFGKLQQCNLISIYLKDLN